MERIYNQTSKRTIEQRKEPTFSFYPFLLLLLFSQELVLSGTPEIDCDDWESNTVYQGGISAESQTVRVS